MPIYDYKCSCGKQFEIQQRMDDSKLTKCERDIHGCPQDGKLTRLISRPVIFFR